VIKIENINVFNIDGAIRGMRNPLESWGNSDSGCCNDVGCANCALEDTDACGYVEPQGAVIGKKDYELALKLATAGSDHGKFLRQILVCADITASMSFFWDFDTYAVAVVKNSTSRMHKLGTRFLTQADFDWSDEDGVLDDSTNRQNQLMALNSEIAEYMECCEDVKNVKDKKTIAVMIKEKRRLFRKLCLDCPASFIFKRTWTGNYENLRDIYFARKNHPQIEFDVFRKWIESLPYSKLITTPRKSIHEKKLEEAFDEVYDVLTTSLIDYNSNKVKEVLKIVKALKEQD
jgi:hypothetical protein